MMKNAKNQKGFLSIIAVLLVVVIALISISATYQSVSDTRQATNSLRSAQAFYLAQSGIEYARHLISNGTNSCGDSFTNISLTGFAGAFSVTTNLSGTQCTLTSTGYASGVTSPTAARTVRMVLRTSGISRAPLVSVGSISLTGNASISNLAVTASSPDYPGSTVNSGSTISITGNFSTAVSGLNPSSTSRNPRADVQQNDSSLTTSTLFGQYFTQTKAQITSAATLVTSASQLKNAVGGTYYSSSNLSLTGNYTIGTINNPTILIVNGNVSITGNSNFYGLIYATGTVQILGNTKINGAVVSESTTQLTGNASIIFNTTILTNAHNTNANTTLHFYSTPLSLREIIP